MKKGKLKVLLCLLLFSLLLSGCEGDYGYYGKADIPPLVEQWREEVEFYADMYGIASSASASQVLGLKACVTTTLQGYLLYLMVTPRYKFTCRLFSVRSYDKDRIKPWA